MFELHGSTYRQISFTKCILLPYSIYSWLDPWMQKLRYRGLAVKKLDIDVFTPWSVSTPKPCVVQRSTVYISFMVSVSVSYF